MQSKKHFRLNKILKILQNYFNKISFHLQIGKSYKRFTCILQFIRHADIVIWKLNSRRPSHNY